MDPRSNLGATLLVLVSACASVKESLPPEIVKDNDLDGVTSDLDCDDEDASLGDRSQDGDCDGTLTEADCNDADPTIHPGAIEQCDGIDQNCNGAPDDGELVGVATGHLGPSDVLALSPSLPMLSPTDGILTEGGLQSVRVGGGTLWVHRDARGRATRLERHEDADGIPEDLWMAAYAGDGNEVATATQWRDGDERDPPLYDVTQELGELGLPIQRDEDLNGDGRADRRYRFTYDEDGRLIEQEVDDGLDGVVDWRATTLLDERGRTTQVAYDLDGDGTVDQLDQWTFQDAPQVVVYTRDSDADGAPDYRTVTELDASDREVRFEESTDGDDEPELTRTRTWNEAGSPLGLSEDRDGDGTVDRTVTYTYGDSDPVDWLTASEDSDGDGVVDQFVRRRFGPHGILRYEIDRDGDGAFDYRERTSYNDLGRRTELTLDEGADDQLEWRYRFVRFDEAGNVLLTTLDRDDDLSIDGSVAVYYCNPDEDEDDLVDWNDCDPRNEGGPGARLSDVDCNGVRNEEEPTVPEDTDQDTDSQHQHTDTDTDT